MKPPISKEQFEGIVDAVCDFYGVTTKSLFLGRRRTAVVHARWTVMYILVTRSNHSYSEIARILNLVSHSSVREGFKKCGELPQLPACLVHINELGLID